MFLKVFIQKYQRGLLFYRGDFRRLLEPGVHYIWERLWRPAATRLELHRIFESRFDHKLLDLLSKEPVLAEALRFVELSDTQRALVWKNDRLACILGAGLYAFWRQPYDLKVEKFDIEKFRLEHERLDVILRHPEASKWLDASVVQPYEEALLFRDGVLVDRFREGRYAFWKGAGSLVFNPVDRREATLDVGGQDIMTGDKVSLRVNLVVTYQVNDALKAVSVVADFAQSLYREAQLVLRSAVGARSLDALLEDKEAIGDEVRRALSRRAEDFGVSVQSVGLRDIILPGDMKAILNQVIAAEKQAQANVIKRREETAAARSQANTARLLAENPILARLKELEVLQEVLAGAKATFVFGEGDIAQRLRGLVAARPPDSGDS